MLTHLQIRDFAIIQRVELEFGDGMSVLTGETGAGKSILLDALSLVLGDRADSGQVRVNADRADISAAFQIDANPSAQRWMTDNEFDLSECILRRTVGADGRSRGYINGQVVTLQSLRELGEHLVDIHGQHEHQQLLRKPVQRELLDDYAGSEKLLNELAGVHRSLTKVTARLEELSAGGDVSGQIDMLQFQIAELSQLDLQPESIAATSREFARLGNAGELVGQCQQIFAELYEDDSSVQARMSHWLQDLERLVEIDESLTSVKQTLGEASILCGDAAGELRSYLSEVDVDEARLAELEAITSALFS
ncbi:MAG: AAA family ATPase, partial [Pseudomonadota bacterium]